jgi:catechol 2,3-dioxygenase-like lactoylglutathione lyase family enzyme
MPDPHPSTGPPSLHAGNLDYLRKQAKHLLRAARAGDTAAIARFTAVLGLPPSTSTTLAHAQLIIARELGFPSWPRLQDELRWRARTRVQHRLGSATPSISGELMSSTKSLNLCPIDQIGLTCTDLDQAEQFYSGILGLRLTGDVPGTMKFFACDGVNIVLFKAATTAPNSIIYFRVPGQPGTIDKKIALLKSLNVKIEADPHEIARNWNGCNVWLAFFRDPFGNLLALKSDVPVTTKQNRPKTKEGK